MMLKPGASPPLNLGIKYVLRMAAINEPELLTEQCLVRLLHCDIDGVCFGNAENEEHESHLILARHHLKENMISVPLFEALNIVNKEPPFHILV